MKKLLLILLTIALLLPATLLTSCEDKKKKPADTSTNDGNELSDVLGFGQQDNGNEEFTILLNNSLEINERDFKADANASDVVSKATYDRNLACEEYLGIALNYIPEAGNWNSGMPKKIQDAVDSGNCPYDMVVMGMNTGIIGGQISSYKNILEMDYINLSHSWWVQDLVEQNSINDQLYFISGDACVTTYAFIGCMYVNLDVASAFNINENFYELVKSGNWTMDKFYDLLKRVERNNDGNPEFDPTKDTYGWCNYDASGVRLMWSSCDMNMIVREDDGRFVLRESLDDKMLTFISKLKDHADTAPHSAYVPAGDEMYNAFVQNRVLFVSGMLSYMEKFKQHNIESAFAVLPLPKYDTNQEDYISTNFPSYNALYFPKIVNSPELSAQVAEYMGWYGQQHVIPAYYDEALKYRQNDDKANVEMIDLLRDTLRVTPNESYGVIGKTEKNSSVSIMSYTQATKYSLTNPDGLYSNPGSFWEKNQKEFAGLIDAYVWSYYE